MSTDVLVTFAILVATVVLFLSDRLRLDVVAIFCLLALALSGVAPLDVVLAGFSNPAVIMIAGLFVVGAALTETGVTAWLGRRLEAFAGDTEARVIATVVLGTALLSAFMSSMGTVALLLPVVGTIAAQRGLAPGRLLMPLAFASHLGSNLTLISTPPNLVVSDALREAGHEPFRFFSFTVPGAIALLAGTAYLCLVGRHFLPQSANAVTGRPRISERDLATEYGLGSAMAFVRIPSGSSLVGLTLGESNLRATLGVSVVGIIRGHESVRVVPRARFEAGDELRVIGSAEAISAMCARYSTEPTSDASSFALPIDESLVEVVLPRRSRLVGQTLREARFRDRYRANVLALRRRSASGPACVAPSELRDLTLRAGDALLLKGRRKYLRNLRDEGADLVLLAEPDLSEVIVDRPKALATGAITLGMLVVMAFGWLPNAIAVLLAVLGVVLARAVRPPDIYRSVNWESVVLIACMIPMATALERTGGTGVVVSAVQRQLHGVPPVVVLALLVVLTSAIGMVLSNTATAILLAPVAVRLGAAFGIAPEPLLMGVAFASSAAFATPIASPVNVLVMTPGGYAFKDYTRVGLPLQLVVLTVAVAVIPLVWPF